MRLECLKIIARLLPEFLFSSCCSSTSMAAIFEMRKKKNETAFIPCLKILDCSVHVF